MNLCDREWKQFVELHDYEIDDLKEVAVRHCVGLSHNKIISQSD